MQPPSRFDAEIDRLASKISHASRFASSLHKQRSRADKNSSQTQGSRTRETKRDHDEACPPKMADRNMSVREKDESKPDKKWKSPATVAVSNDEPGSMHHRTTAHGAEEHGGHTNALEEEFAPIHVDEHSSRRFDAFAVLVVMSFKVIVAPIILIVICVNTQYIKAPYMFRAASESYLGYSIEDSELTYSCPECAIGCEQTVLLLSHFGSDALMGKPAFSTLLTSELANTTLSASEESLAKALDGKSAICAAGSTDRDELVLFIAALPPLIVDTIDTLGLSISEDMMAEITDSSTQNSTDRWVIEARLKSFWFQPIPHINEYSSILAADLTLFPEKTKTRSVVWYDQTVNLTRSFALEGTDSTSNAPTTLRLFPYNFNCTINIISRNVVPVGEKSTSTDTIVQPQLRAYYGGCPVRLVNTTGIFTDLNCEISSNWIDYGLMLQGPNNIPLCSTDGTCVHNYYNSQWEWVSTTESTNVQMAYNSIRSRYADKVEMSVLPGLVVMQILVMSMLSMYQVMGQKQSVILSQIWAYRCQNGRMQAVYLLQIAYHLYQSSDIYYLALGTGTMSIEAAWNLTFCVLAFSYSFVNILKSRTGEQQLDRYFRLSWELVLLIVTAIVVNALLQARYTSLKYILDSNSQTLYKTSTEGAKRCKLTDSCIVFKINIAVVIALVSLLFWAFTSFLSYVLRTRHDPHPVRDFLGWLSSWKPSTAPRKPRMSISSSGPIVELPGATTFESYCIGEHFRFMFNDCEDISHVKVGAHKVPSAEAVLLAGFVYRGKYLYRADDVILLLFTRFLPNFILRTFNVLIVRWMVDPKTYVVSKPTVCLWTEVGVDWREKTKPFPSA
jgi:hypothetical protein